jgi:phosphate transport system permease protein
MRPLLTEQRKDRLATALIRAGGVLVILVVLGIVINIGAEAVPLFGGAAEGPIEIVTEGGGPLLAGSDPRREVVWVLYPDGNIRFPGVGGFEELEIRHASTSSLAAADHEIHGLISAISEDGEVVVGRLRFRDSWEGDVRHTTVSWRSEADPLVLDGNRWAGVTANRDENGNLLTVAWTKEGILSLASWDNEDESWQKLPSPALIDDVRQAAVAEGLASLSVLRDDGHVHVLRWPSLEAASVVGIQGPVAAVRYLIGGGTLVAAGVDGSVDVLLEVPRLEVENMGPGPLHLSGATIGPGEAAVVPDDEISQRFSTRPDIELSSAPSQWAVVRTAAPLSTAPTVIAPASRRRGFAIGGEDGGVALYYSTSARRLIIDRWTDDPVRALAIDPKSDGIVTVSGGSVLRRWIDNPHPEISFRTLFLPVWYEGYAARKWVWQSTGGSDSFEPKLSVWPLIFGTLKATLYAMLFSLPLALSAAVYVSQLAPPWLQATVKPTLELMAAVPSVVVGFLAALWLAPRLEAALLAVLIGAATLPLSVVLALSVWRLIPGGWRRRLPDGIELFVLLISGAAVTALAALIAGPIEAHFFGGDFQRFLFTELGLRYDQRNSIVVGLGLGFAVIPVIFTIAEDACSAVPRALVNASRALGATRWQTAVRLVVPAASPGLFAAVMLGLGRAVGETMIVLMAAGNTPVLDLSIFNGMRTMSAAIAVEIPEAPVGGTLFRVLFLTGTLLFVFTFVLTTVADLVGSYLRKRYARF